MRLETERARLRVALALWALLLGCAAERVPGRPNRVEGSVCPAYPEPIFPDSGETCPAADETPPAAPPSCVPVTARGRERSQDGSPGVRVFQACERRVTDEDLTTGTVDRGRVLIERSGERPATPEELREAVRNPHDWNVSIWTQVHGIGPCPLSKGPDPDRAPQSCLFASSTDRNVRDIGESFAKALAGHPELCIPIVVEVGVADGCIRHLHLD
jgi:hypothetical protein